MILYTFDSEENNIMILIKTISLCFIRIRHFHEVKQIYYEMIGKNKRKVLITEQQQQISTRERNKYTKKTRKRRKEQRSATT